MDRSLGLLIDGLLLLCASKRAVPMVRWLRVSSRYTAKTPTGALELFIDGATVISVEGLNIPGESQGMHFQTFFGGTTKSSVFLAAV